METLESLQRRINATTKLEGIVKSMKTLAAVSIRQYERAALSLEKYLAIIEQGLEVVIRHSPEVLPVGKQEGAAGRLLVVFGSDQGLCGRFNEKLADFIGGRIAGWRDSAASPELLVVGARVGARLEAAGRAVSEQFWVPGSVGGITPMVNQILLSLEAARSRRRISHIDLFFNRHQPGTPGVAVRQQLLPLDLDRLVELGGRQWPGRSIPQFRASAAELFSALIRQYFFVSLFRAQAQSLAAEQASRLQSLQNAEKNIEEHAGELLAEYRVKRQATITSELLDLVAGFKTTAGRRKRKSPVESAESAAEIQAW